MPQNTQPTAPDMIRSARNWLDRYPVSKHFLKILHDISNEFPNSVSFPSRIIKAWKCEEENGEDIVYIEVVMPSVEEVFQGVHISEAQYMVLGEYKIARGLVRREDYTQLLGLQKDHLEEKWQGLDELNRLLVRRIDHDHVFSLTSRSPDVQSMDEFYKLLEQELKKR